jgi:threonine dehydratase
MSTSRRDVAAAAERLRGRVRLTPVLQVEAGVFAARTPVALKLEVFQHAGSFKARGMFNRILSAGAPTGEVIIASGGNAGLAVAYAARELGLRAEVFVPEAVSSVKLAGLHALGAQVVVTGSYYADAYLAMERRASVTGASVVHAYDQPEVVAGQGTIARELEQQVDGIDTVLVAVGGGGLLAGIATWLEGRAKIVAVEPERAPTLARALDAGEPVDVDVSGVAAGALGARRISSTALAVARSTSVESVLVSDDAILSARRRLWDSARVAAEPGGAAALAALTSERYRPSAGECVAAIVSGGNADPADLASPEH